MSPSKSLVAGTKGPCSRATPSRCPLLSPPTGQIQNREQKTAGVAARGNEIGTVEAKRVHAVGACGRVSSAVGVMGDALRSGQKPEESNDDT